MTDHNSPAGAVGGGQPSGQPGSFGPPQQPQQQAWQAQGHGHQPPVPHQAQPAAPQPSHPQPQQLPSDAARAQVAAAWVRNTPQAGQAAVPALPPRETRPASESKKEKRERERAARKAAYEQKKTAKEQRKKGGSATAAAATAATAAHPAASAPQAPSVGNQPLALGTRPGTPAGAPTPAKGAAGNASAATGHRPVRDFDVPRPGGRAPAGGRRTHVALRATLLITTCVFALGSCGVMGMVVGASSGSVTAGLDSDDAAKYRLTDFPTQQAATFAEQYALLCMTYSPETASTRRSDLARYASAGVDQDCGWGGQGSSTALSATWDGTTEQFAEFGAHGRYLGVQVRTKDGRLTSLSVPVYVKDLATGDGMRVAGDVGQMPMPPRADVPAVDQNAEVVDDELSRQLQEKVLPGYFEAWGASDSTSMARFITSDATITATSGLVGQLTDPKVNEVVALVPASVQDSDPYAYANGQSVQLRVAVDWTDPKSGTTVLRSYRMTVVNTAQGWFIKDIRGGVRDAEGGRADSDAEPAPEATGSPSASPSPSASSTDKQADKKPNKS
ncbi:conjugal transfer protein [Streptomyces europaeiscabiei]|uniref:conjugal transfer protein n=1 Tax=Streptomyces europaeiscabiei TaxID=146819 RepID=UPI0029AC2160|nr:conjugal transfer protein [Streptomyces europaeiscabiei]MDX3864534.1 conjugal transfer protein [Streptomyces europaeiscabiei]MDX3871384.1 conjugal transfer protein [Streptomyces europaeiscabiei]